MKKRIMALVLMGILTFSGVNIVNYPAYALTEQSSTTVFANNSFRVGKVQKLDLSNITVGDDTYLSYIAYYPESDDEMATYVGSDYVAEVTTTVGGKYVYIRTITSGTVFIKIVFSNGEKVIITGDSEDFGSSYDDINFADFWGVIKTASTTNFQYSKVRLEPDITSDGKIIQFFVYADIYNKSDKTLTPDMRVEFLDENKNVIGYAQASNQIGSTINIKLPSKKVYTNFAMSADESELDPSKVNDIAYWRVVEPISDISSTSSGDKKPSTTPVKADITDDEIVSTEDTSIIKGAIIGVSKLSKNSVKLTWNFSSPKYTIQYATNSKFKNKKIKYTSNKYIKLTKLKVGKTYYVRVKGKNKTWSNVTSFKL